MELPLYEIKSYTHDSATNSILATIDLNANHNVFKGHFPQTPVLPGVSMIQIIKDLVEKSYHAPKLLKSASNIKYLSLVQPDGKLLEFAITIKPNEDNTFAVSNILTKDGVVCMKFAGTYINK